MKKLLLAACLISMLAFNANAQLKFRGITLGRPIDSVIAELSKLGYSLKSDDGTVAMMSGSFSGKDDCTIGVISTPKSHLVWKVVVILPERDTWSSIKNEYITFKESLGKKYRPGESYQFFSKPYYYGDGFELQAIRMKKCTYFSIFYADEGAISVEIKQGSSDPALFISYEDTAASKLHSAEKSQTIEDDL